MASGKYFNRNNGQQIQGCVPQLCITPCFFPLLTLISGMQTALQLVLILPLLSHARTMSHTHLSWRSGRGTGNLLLLSHFLSECRLWTCLATFHFRLDQVSKYQAKRWAPLCDLKKKNYRVGHHIGAAGFNGIYALSSVLQTFPPAASRSNYILIIFW